MSFDENVEKKKNITPRDPLCDLKIYTGTVGAMRTIGIMGNTGNTGTLGTLRTMENEKKLLQELWCK